MDTIETTLQRLARMGLMNPSHTLAEQVRLMYAMPRIPDPSTLAAMQIGETVRAQIEKLNAGYGLGNVWREVAERHEALRLALTNSYANLTIGSALAASQLSTISSLQQQIERIGSPVSQLQNVLAALQAPGKLLQAASMLEVDGGLIGEFGFSEEQEPHAQDREADAESQERQEVKSRIVQVGYLPQKLFQAIQGSPELMRGLAPREFEEFTAELLHRLGFESIELTPRSGDGGRDVVATRVVNDIPIIMAFECKLYESNRIGPDILRALLGTITHGRTRASMGVLVTASSFTSGARSFIAAEAAIDGKDFEALSRWLTLAKGNVRAG